MWNKRLNKWTSQIGVERKMVYLGQFTGKNDAAAAYNEAAIRFHGEFAVLNQIGE